MHSIIKHLKTLTLIPATGCLVALSLMASSASVTAMEKSSREHQQLGDAHHNQQDGKKHHGKPEKHHKMRRVHEIINAYKLERGEISQAEIDEQKQAHQTMRTEFKALREAGDVTAVAAMKAQFKAQHQATRSYVEAHPELKEQLDSLRAEHGKGYGEHRKMKQMHKIVTAYKLKNGDITEAEVEQQKQEHQAKRKALHDYIEAHPELQEQLKEARHSQKK